MTSTGRFRTDPKPNDEVIELLERALESAKHGHIPTLAIVIVNIVNQTEPLLAGDLTRIRADALLGGLARAVNEIISRES